MITKREPIELKYLQPMQVGETHNVDENKKLFYILLKKDEESYTVFTSEGDGFVMTCTTKKIFVDLCFSPESENLNLTNYTYANKIYESLRQKAIKYLNDPNKPLKQQGRLVQFETKANLRGQQNNIVNKKKLSQADTIEGIQKLDEEAKTATPERKKRIAYQIERGTIAKRAKKLAEYKCLICEAVGVSPISFIKRNSKIPYVEIHHIEHASLLIKGSLALHNLITVCANHHRQFHYGNLEIIDQTERHFYFDIDGRKEKIQKLRIE